MDMIRIDVGVYTSLEVDLTDFDFSGITKVIMTGRNAFSGDAFFEREFTTPELHYIDITPEESNAAGDDAEYDFDIVTDNGKRYKNGDNGKVMLRRGCGRCNESESED